MSNYIIYLSGIVVYDFELNLGWGKSISLPSQALPAPPPGHMAIRSKEVDLFIRRAIVVVLFCLN